MPWFQDYLYLDPRLAAVAELLKEVLLHESLTPEEAAGFQDLHALLLARHEAWLDRLLESALQHDPVETRRLIEEKSLAAGRDPNEILDPLLDRLLTKLGDPQKDRIH